MRLRELVDLVTRSSAGSADFVRGARLLAARAFSADEPVASAATSAIFLDIVEPWSDRFSPAHCDAYVAFMSEVMYASGSPVAAELARQGLQGPAELARRYSSIRTAGRPDPLDPERVTTAVVLSRVTLGADVAVTSAVIRAVLRAFPRTSVTFLAPRKNLALLAGDERIDGREVSYGRSSLLAERLAAWPMIREQVQACSVGLSPGQSVVIDPDSRLTQLGLLPVTDDRHYRFFESRSWLPESPAPLGRVATEWCASMWGIDAEPVRPFVRSGFGEEALCDQLRTGSVRPVSTISLGVGGRESKRLDGRFEDALLDLLRERGYASVLDCGAGETEARRAGRRYRAFTGSKCHRDEGSRAPLEPSSLMTWRGSMHGFGNLIGASQVYVGYDSAAAHLAAAQGVPVISIFAGAPSATFRRRWTPWGPGPVTVIPAEGPHCRDTVLARVGQALDALGQAPAGKRNDRD